MANKKKSLLVNSAISNQGKMNIQHFLLLVGLIAILLFLVSCAM